MINPNETEDISHDPFHPRHLDRALWNTNQHEDEPEDGIRFFEGVGISLGIMLAAYVVIRLFA